MLDEFNGLEIFPSAIAIGDPLSFLTCVIEIQHGGDRINPQSIDMVFIEPEEGTGDEKITYFLTTVIVDERTPFGMA